MIGLQLYAKTPKSMRMQDAQGKDVQTELIDRSHEYVITQIVATSAIVSNWKTYTLSPLPVALMPTTVSILYGDFRSVSLPSAQNRGTLSESNQPLEVSVSLREISLTTPRHLNEWAQWNRHTTVPVGTFCRSDSDDSAETCTRFCNLDPRCFRSFSTSAGCCFVMSQFHTPNADAACWKENNASVKRPLRRLPYLSSAVNGDSMSNVSGNAMFGSGQKWTRLPLTGWSNGVIQWKADDVKAAPTYLKLSKLEAWHPVEGMYLKVSQGTPSFASTLVALEDISDDELAVSNNCSRYKITVVIMLKYWDFRKRGHGFYMHVAPLLDDVGFEARSHIQKEYHGVSRPLEKLADIFNTSCDGSDAAKLFQMCGGPVEPTIASTYVSLWRKPQKMGTFSVTARQTSAPLFEPLQVDLDLYLQNQAALPYWLEQQGCEVLNKTAENVATLGVPKDSFTTFACMVLQSGCRTLTMVQDQGFSATLPVLPVAGQSLEHRQQSILTMAEQRHWTLSVARAELALCAAAHPDFTQGMLLNVSELNIRALLRTARDFPQGAFWLQRLLSSSGQWRRSKLLKESLLLENPEGKHGALVMVATEALARTSPRSWLPDERLSEVFFEMLKDRKNLAVAVGLKHNLQVMLETLRRTLPDDVFAGFSNYLVRRYLDLFDSDDRHNPEVIMHLEDNMCFLMNHSYLMPDTLSVNTESYINRRFWRGRGHLGEMEVVRDVQEFIKSQVALLKGDCHFGREHKKITTSTYLTQF
eukprot:2063491-Amphidinium_carterae.1